MDKGSGSTGSSRPAAVGLLVLLAMMTAWWAWLSPALQPPPVVPASAPATEFSAGRAREHLRVLAEQPRPIGSAAHSRSREYVIRVLRDLGLEPGVQQATGVRGFPRWAVHSRVGNVFARIPGTGNGPAVVLTAHYDSVPHSPGANDAGNGVAAVLETARALLAGPPLRNDVILLLTDAEEVGLVGAHAWVSEHPWAADTGVVLSAEGRGNAGPVYMFRTVGGNGGMVRVLASAAPWALADSASDEMFRHMPNDTDLAMFRDAGYLGMDFANVRGFNHYHTAIDSFDLADPRTLQHHGEYLLALARAFGNEDLSALEAPRRIYFGVPLAGVVHYPAAWALPLAVAAALLLAWLAVVLYRRGQWRLRGAGVGLLHFAGALVALPLLAMLAWALVGRWVPELDWFAHGEPYAGQRYLLGLALLATAAYVASLAWLRRAARPAELLLAPLLAWLLLGVASAAWVPGASYLFLWPLLSAMAALALLQLPALRRPAAIAAILALGAVPVVHFTVPIISGVEEAATMHALPVAILVLVLVLGLLSPQLDFVRRPTGAIVPLLLAAAGAGVLAATVLDAGFDERRRKPHSLEYIADAGSGEALWVSADPALDAWTRHYLGDDPDRGPLPDWAPPVSSHAGQPWSRPAAMVRTGGPDARVLEDTVDGGLRRLRILVSVPPDAYATVTQFPQGVPVTALRVDGQLLDDRTRDGLQLTSYVTAPEGVELAFTVPAEAPLELQLRSSIIGLPTPGAGPVPERPPHTMPAGPWTERTRLQRTVVL